MNLRNLQQKHTSESLGDYTYNDIPIFCARGIHEAIFDSFLETNIDKNKNILVLGSGPGAFEQRLLNAGYTNITSVEFVAESFIVKGTKFLPLDLNQDFSHLGPFDAIFAIELIEHLENQFHFMRSIKSLMNKDTVFYLSTPNAESTFARIKYFLVGKLQYFGPRELEGTGHITPIFNHILKFNLSQNNLRIEDHFTNANVWIQLMQHKSFIIKIVYRLTFIISLFMLEKDTREINLFKIVSS